MASTADRLLSEEEEDEEEEVEVEEEEGGTGVGESGSGRLPQYLLRSDWLSIVT